MDPIKFASIIATYRCNARCHMCGIWEHATKPDEEIGPDVIAKIPFVPTINLTGGEPFLRADIREVIDVLKRRSKRLVISTNGFWTDKILEVAEKYPDIGIRVSIEGLPKANDELRGIRDGFDKGLRTLLTLIRMGLKDVGFAITLSDKNAKDLMELHTLAKAMRVEFATAAVHNSFYFHKHDNRIENPDLMVAELEKLISALLHSRRIKDWFRAYFNYGLQNYAKGNPRLLPCKMGRHAFFLDPYGEVLACNGTPTPMSMGNLKTKSFEEIWNGAEAKKVREAARTCARNCWMMGSVAEPMKENLGTVIKWVVKRKIFGR